MLAFSAIVYENKNLLIYAASRRSFLYLLWEWISRDLNIETAAFLLLGTAIAYAGSKGLGPSHLKHSVVQRRL